MALAPIFLNECQTNPKGAPTAKGCRCPLQGASLIPPPIQGWTQLSRSQVYSAKVLLERYWVLCTFMLYFDSVEIHELINVSNLGSRLTSNPPCGP